MQSAAAQTQLSVQIELSLARLGQTNTMFAAVSEQERELASLVAVIRGEAARLSAFLTTPQLPAIQAHLANISSLVDEAQAVLREEQAETSELSVLANSMESIRDEPLVASLAASATQWSTDAFELVELVKRAEQLTTSTVHNYTELVEEIRDVGGKLGVVLTSGARGGYREPPF